MYQMAQLQTITATPSIEDNTIDLLTNIREEAIIELSVNLNPHPIDDTQVRQSTLAAMSRPIPMSKVLF